MVVKMPDMGIKPLGASAAAPKPMKPMKPMKPLGAGAGAPKLTGIANARAHGGNAYAYGHDKQAAAPVAAQAAVPQPVAPQTPAAPQPAAQAQLPSFLTGPSTAALSPDGAVDAASRVPVPQAPPPVPMPAPPAVAMGPRMPGMSTAQVAALDPAKWTALQRKLLGGV